MISFFDNLVIKSNPQAKEEILSLKKPLAAAKPKVKECMKRSRPSSDSTQMSGNSSGTSEGIDGETPSPPKKRDTRPHKGSGGAGGKGDPPEKPDKPGDSKVDNTEIIQELLEELMVLLDQIRAKFEKMIVELNPEAQRILLEKFNEFYQHFYEEIQKFNQLPSNTSIEKINRVYESLRYQIEQRFNDEFRNRIGAIIEANEQVNGTIQNIEKTFETNIVQIPSEATREEIRQQFEAFIKDVQNGLNRCIAREGNFREIQTFERELDIRFRREIMSKINVPILKKSYRHAASRGDTPQHPYTGQDSQPKISKKPKLAQMLERDTAISLSGREVILHTPFGDVRIKRGTKANSRLIITTHFPRGPRYTEISRYLDNYYSHNPEATLQMLRAILEYLEIPTRPYDTVYNALNQINVRVKTNPSLMPRARVEALECAAALCGILLVCESGQDRSENGGKRERGIIRTLIRIIESRTSTTPFADAFGRASRSGSPAEGFYTPSAVADLDRSVSPPRTNTHGGNVRSKVVVGKEISSRVRPPISPRVLEKDQKDTGELDLSSDSETDYDAARDIFEIDTRRYRTTDNLGTNGGCLWRILRAHDVTQENLEAAARNTGITYNDFVNIENLERLLNEINRLGDYNLALHIDVFDYAGRYYRAISGFIPTPSPVGSTIINIALIYDRDSGQGHYVEKL